MPNIITAGSEHVYLDSETRSKIWALAEARGVARNQIIKEAVMQYVAGQETQETGDGNPK